jgi:hypothetical protein
MVSLIAYEWKKCFLKRSIVIALLVFSMINVVKIHSIYQQESSLAANETWTQAYWQLYEDYSGEITVPKIENLMGFFRPLEAKIADRTATTAMDVPGTYTGNLYSDYYLLDWYYVKPMEYDYMYRTNSDKIAAAAAGNVAFYEERGNQYDCRKNAAIAELFAGRRVSDFQYTEMYQYLVQYDFSSLLVLLLCIFGIASVFATEKETEMELLLLTARSGGHKTIFAKIAASLLFAAAICVWFWLLDFAAYSVSFGTLAGADMPVYSLRDFANSPLEMPLGAYAFISSISKTIGIIAICLCFLFIANLFKNALLPFIVSTLSAIAMIFYGEMLWGSSHVLLKAINPFALVVNRELFRKTEFIDVFGFPVLSYIFAFIAGAIWILVFGALTVRLSQKNTVGLKERRI